MGPISRFAVNKPWIAIGAWIIILIAIFGGASKFAGAYNDSFSLPNTESTTAQEILQAKFGDMASNANANIVFSPATGTIEQPAVKTAMESLAAQVQSIGSVAMVETPYQPGAAMRGLVSPNGEVGRMQVTFKVPDDEAPVSDVRQLVSDVQAANSDEIAVGVGGQIVDFAGGEPPASEGIGILVAIVILLIMFGSIIAAGLPILTALIGLGAGISLVTLAANFVNIATFGPTLAAMIGLGVGIDYALFVINRYRQAVLAGREPKEAAIEAVNTAGRAVVFAGITVVIALGGLFVLGLSFMNGLAIGAGITVITVMFTAVTLLPAVLSLLGRKAFAWRMPWARKPKATPEGRGFASYGNGLQKRPWLYGGLAFLFMVILAIPMFEMRSGFPDAGGRPDSNTTRVAYDLTTEGFGAGANGPFLVVVEMPNAESVPAANELSQKLAATPGVAVATPVVPGTPSITPDGKAAIIQVQPTTGPQDVATSELLDNLRQNVIPAATAGTGLTAYIGGSTAIVEDFSQVLSDALPLFLAVVVGLGFLVLVLLFRSLVIPLTAALTALLSFGAALGVTVFVFQMGNLTSLFGVTGTGPILPFLPIMLFSILFGLSMDYQVFLVSRMQEEWSRTKDNRVAVRRGLGGSGRVVAAAAAIMFSVFISFVFGDDTTIKMFGLALAVAIALDAFVIRLVLVPSLMTVLGSANWYLPGWLQKILPEVHIESEEEAAEIADIEDAGVLDAETSPVASQEPPAK
ncbi:MAG: MMPL family transporter [Candidatus Nanopelagicales bacterium]